MPANTLEKEITMSIRRILCRKCGNKLNASIALDVSIELDNKPSAIGFSVSDSQGFAVHVDPCEICTEEL